ncbi:MAG: phosphatidate cytidylyltransferase [Pseudomonadota bacterium]
MLRQRLITAFLIIPWIVMGALYLPNPWLAFLLALLVLGCAWEWAGLCGVMAPAGRLAYVAGMAVILWLLHPPGPQTLCLLGGVTLGWLGIVLWLSSVRVIPGASGLDGGLLVAGVAIWVPPWLALVWLDRQPQGPAWMLALLILIWTADSAAYFVGRQYGTRRLAPQISPGKSLEGAVAALGSAALLALGLAWQLDKPLDAALGLVVLAVVTAALSIAGDLLESWLKRRRSVKDSGALLPGHGGLLDRLDSLTAAAPCFVWGGYWLGLWS